MWERTEKVISKQPVVSVDDMSVIKGAGKDKIRIISQKLAIQTIYFHLWILKIFCITFDSFEYRSIDLRVVESEIHEHFDRSKDHWDAWLF